MMKLFTHKTISATFIALLLAGCSIKSTKHDSIGQSITEEISQKLSNTSAKIVNAFAKVEPKTLANFSQNPLDYANFRWQNSLDSQKNLKKDYLARHFLPWSKPEPRDGRLVALWGLEGARNNPGYGENLEPNSSAWIEKLAQNIDEASYPNMHEMAIITTDTNARVMPTDKPRFHSPNRAGEGYPFDYWQNSYLFSGTPVLITHATKNRDWFYVEASFVSGWIKSDAIARAGHDFRAEVDSALGLVVPLRDSIALHDENGEFLENARIGKLYVIHELGESNITLLVPKRGLNGEAIWRKARVKRDNFAPFPLRYSAQNLAQLAQNLMGEKYGWGGMYGNRDCSAFVRDIVGSAGVWLPRNSAAQAKHGGGYISLSELEPLEREQRILQEAIPFASLIYMRGHIMLYIGEKDGRAMVLHDVWGLRQSIDGSEKRWILGGVVITDLEVGKGVNGIEDKSLLLNRIDGFRNLLVKEELK
ncbi:MAG: SH3 domain-containing protein [Wolinella sp.]